MKKGFIVVLCVLLFATALAGCNKGAATPDEATVSSENAPAEDIETFAIKTAYADLAYPKQWENDVKVDIDETNGYVVSFSADGVKLFDLQFNCGSGDVMGTLVRDSENVILRAAFAKLDENDSNYKKHVEMQGGLDVILSHLAKDYNFAEGEENYVNTSEVYEIKTDVVSLYYPKQWENKVKVDVTDNGVYFSYKDVKLFDILFGTAEGAYLLGTYDGKDVSIVSYDLQQGDLSDNDFTTLRAMQESIDVIISNLEKDGNFRPSSK